MILGVADGGEKKKITIILIRNNPLDMWGAIVKQD